MPDHSDLTFITNEQGQHLLDRFRVLIKDADLFDVLVGYFYISGFHALYHSLEHTERIRILIGIGTNQQTSAVIQRARREETFSHAETQAQCSDLLVGEMAQAEDSRDVQEGVRKFLAWLESGKMEIKAYRTERLHAKLYILSFAEGDRDAGRVITGSSNFTQAGLVDNLEFNVELKARADYDFAREKFEDLWEDAVDVKDRYIQTIREDTWFNDTITPYQLYLKCLYEYFKDELHQADDVTLRYVPAEFKRLAYQEQAVLNAKKILEAYGGVFLSDVVGLGKTYVSAMLAGRLDGRTLVLAPPVLLDRNNPGSWPNVFSDFRVPADYASLGTLDQIVARGTEQYTNVFIDEAHRFRTETNVTYETLAQICRGKRVVLVTATPFNNTPKDILSQIKLFQSAKKSTIPNVPDLEKFFGRLEKNIATLDRTNDHDEYMRTAKENAHVIRTSVLKYLMVRRTRNDVGKYFADDLHKQGLKFPEVENPEPVLYQLNEKENEVFHNTVALITEKLRYARYMPLLYYTGKDTPGQMEKQAQTNLSRFMKILLIKRLESSFHAFRNTVDRFIANYDLFIKELKKGNVYVSKKYAQKIFELLDNDDETAIQDLLANDKAKKYPANDFADDLTKDVDTDLRILRDIREMWLGVTRDPKLIAFVELLSTHPSLQNTPLIVFSESRETAEYLAVHLSTHFPKSVLAFSGSSDAATRKKVIANFDARARHHKTNYRILVTTDVLSEGVNLHSSNVVINYDIPWNPTRLMQRVGRINRVDTKFDKIYSFNFFPTKQSNDQIQLTEAAKAKIQAFITLLGADARLLTDSEDVESHALFDRLTSKATITGEDEEGDSELKYLHVIRDIRDHHQDVFDAVKRLPKKARTARKRRGDTEGRVLTYFRQGKLQKFFLAGTGDSKEIDFMDAAGRLEAETTTTREPLPADFYDKLEKNKEAFRLATSEEEAEPHTHGGGRDSTAQLLKTVRAMRRDTRQYTEDQEAYLQRVMNRLEEGALPKQTSRTALKALENELHQGRQNPLTLLGCLQRTIPDALLARHIAEHADAAHTGPGEVILSEYLMPD